MPEAHDGGPPDDRGPLPERVLALGGLVLLVVSVLLQVGEPGSYHFLVAGVTALLAGVALTRPALTPPPPPLAAAAVWLLFGAVHGLFFASNAYTARVGVARRGTQVGALAVFAAAGSTPAGMTALRGGLVFTGAVSGLSAVADRLGGKAERAHWMGGEDRPGAGRATRVGGLFGNPNLLGGFLAMVLPVAVRAACGAGPGAALGKLALGATAAGLGASYSRSSWLAALTGLLFLVWRTPRPRRGELFAGMLPGLAAFLVAAPGALARALSTVNRASFGVSQRLLLFRGICRMILAAPLLGFGIGSFHSVYPAYRLVGGQYPFDAHGQLLQEAVESGIFGAAAFLVFLASAFSAARRGAADPRRGDRRDLEAGLVTAACLSLFASPLSYTPLAIPLMALFGGACAPGDTPRRGGPEGGEATRAVLGLGLALAVFGGLGVLVAEEARAAARARLRSLEGLAAGPARRRAAAEVLDDLERALESAATFDPGAPGDLALLAEASLARGAAEAAEARFREVLRRDPYESLAWRGIARTWAARGEDRRAAEALREALRLDPHAEDALHEMARVLLRLGEPARAEALLRRALETNPAFLWVNRATYPAIFLELIGLLESQGRAGEAGELRARYLELYGG